MPDAVILACDVGTSGVKCSMITGAGVVLDSETAAYDTIYLPGGISEQKPGDWWNSICAAVRKLAERNAQHSKNIAAIGVSGHMLGCVPVAADGSALGNAMIHSDSRAREQFARVDAAIGAQRLYEMSGNVLDARSPLCKILWLKENAPEIYNKTAKFLQSKDYVVSRLTGNIDTTDYSDACHAELMDIRSRSYDQGLFAELGIDFSKLPQLHKGCEVVGKTTAEAARALGIPDGIPVIAGGGDGACGSLGAGNIAVGDAYLSLGTTAWIAQVSAEPVIDPQSRVFNIMNLDGESCSVYGAMQAAGSSIVWIQRLLGIDDLGELNRIAGAVEPGCGGLVFLPYLDGERSPIFDAQAKGVFMGMSQTHDRGHFARAVFEGVAYALKNILDIFRERGELDAIRAIGGGVKSELWRGIIADVCRIGIQTLSVAAADSTSLGVAAAAGVGAGIFSDMRQATSFIRVQDTLEPGNIRPAYERNYSVYKGLYPSLKDAMHALAD